MNDPRVTVRLLRLRAVLQRCGEQDASSSCRYRDQVEGVLFWVDDASLRELYFVAGGGCIGEPSTVQRRHVAAQIALWVQQGEIILNAYSILREYRERMRIVADARYVGDPDYLAYIEARMAGAS